MESDFKTDSIIIRQETLAKLRERYLYLISNLCRENECEIEMYENTSVKCRVKAFDPNFESIIVENLQTPLQISVEKAILRTSDIISMKFRSNNADLLK